MQVPSSVLAAVLAMAACERPQPLVICHNANCVSPDTSRDDTLSALAESLALGYAGRPVIDGMELDTFWYRAEGRCLFAHDLDGDTLTTPRDAATIIADHLAGTDAPSWNGERFHVFIDLKAHVGPSYDELHSPEELVAHAECALDTVDTIAAGARARGHQLTVGFISGRPRHLEILRASPRFQPAADVELLLIGDIFAPYSDLVPELADYQVPLDAIEYHPDFMTEVHRETYRALEIDLVQWSFVTTIEAFDAIERWEPSYVVTNEAELMRRWIER